jgi:hypothetical protein
VVRLGVMRGRVRRVGDEPRTEEEPDEQNGEALETTSEVQPFADPDPELLLKPPKESREPGLPPPRD